MQRLHWRGDTGYRDAGQCASPKARNITMMFRALNDNNLERCPGNQQESIDSAVPARTGSAGVADCKPCRDGRQSATRDAFKIN